MLIVLSVKYGSNGKMLEIEALEDSGILTDITEDVMKGKIKID